MSLSSQSRLRRSSVQGNHQLLAEAEDDAPLLSALFERWFSCSRDSAAGSVNLGHRTDRSASEALRQCRDSLGRFEIKEM